VAESLATPSAGSETLPRSSHPRAIASLDVWRLRGEGSHPEPRLSTDAARLSQLDSRQKSRVECGPLVKSAQARHCARALPQAHPDIPLFTPGAGLHRPISFEPIRRFRVRFPGDPRLYVRRDPLQTTHSRRPTLIVVYRSGSPTPLSHNGSATSVPLLTSLKRRLDALDLDPGTPVVTICKTAHRSVHVTLLLRQGFPRVAAR
jgi:rhodanese-related sulfurtransferase